MKKLLFGLIALSSLSVSAATITANCTEVLNGNANGKALLEVKSMNVEIVTDTAVPHVKIEGEATAYGRSSGVTTEEMDQFLDNPKLKVKNGKLSYKSSYRSPFMYPPGFSKELKLDLKTGLGTYLTQLHFKLIGGKAVDQISLEFRCKLD